MEPRCLQSSAENLSPDLLPGSGLKKPNIDLGEMGNSFIYCWISKERRGDGEIKNSRERGRDVEGLRVQQGLGNLNFN